MKLDHFDHLVITTANLEKCIYFYTEILGMALDRSNNRYAVTFGDQKINIHRKKAEALPAAKNVTYGSQDFCLIAIGDINEIKQEIITKGYPIEHGIVERNGARGKMDSLYLRDADENLIEISVYKKK